MNIKFSTEERKALFKDMVDDETKSLVRDLFRKEYAEIIKYVAQTKIDRVMDENRHIFLDKFKQVVEHELKDAVKRNFGKGSQGVGYLSTGSGLYFNEETTAKIVTELVDEVKKEFNMKVFKEQVRAEVIKKLTQ